VVWTQKFGSKYRIYVQGENDRLKAFQYENGKFRDGQGQALTCLSRMNAAPIDESNEIAPQKTMPGGILSLSSDQQQSGSALLWVSIPKGGEGDPENSRRQNPVTRVWEPNLVTGLLRAYDAADLHNHLLWENELDAGSYAKFVPPTVANGKVYMAELGKVAVFGQWSPWTPDPIGGDPRPTPPCPPGWHLAHDGGFPHCIAGEYFQ